MNALAVRWFETLDGQTAVSLLLVVIAAAWMTRRFFKRRGSCGTGCGHCAGHKEQDAAIVDLSIGPEKQKTAGP
jgi:hypothetical protein